MEPGAPAFVTVTDAAGRVLFRRPATQAEIDEAIAVADAADAEAVAALKRIAKVRTQVLARPPAAEVASFEEPAPQSFDAGPTIVDEGGFEDWTEMPAFDEPASEGP